MSAPCITVVGSVNLDLVASCERLPAAGETILGGVFNRFPGGKGANQALAARRLGGETRMIARVGADAEADAALALLREDGVGLAACLATPDASTGVALIAVSADGENQIVVAPGANAALSPEDLPGRIEGALIGQLETPVETLLAAAQRCAGLVSLNLAPAAATPEPLLDRADLLIVNETEADWYGLERLQARSGLTALTLGARGAVLFRGDEEIARAEPPQVQAVDTTGAGDTFVAALTLALVEGRDPQAALGFACAAGALSTTRPGAQPALPRRAEVEALLQD